MRVLNATMWRAMVLVAALLLAGLAAACSSDSSNKTSKADIEATVTDAVAAWNAQDVDGFLALVTDNFLAENGITREEAQAGLAEEMAMDETNVLGAFSGTTVSGSTASTTAVLYDGTMGAPEEFKVVKDGDAWLVDSAPYVMGDAPAGANVISLKLSEYAFTFDASAITDGNIAFDTSNIGGQDHEVAIVSPPADMAVDDLLQQIEEQQDVPENVEFVGAVSPIPVGTETMIQFQEPLAPGHYVLVCFMQDAEGTPHAFLGMTAEFNVE